MKVKGPDWQCELRGRPDSKLPVRRQPEFRQYGNRDTDTSTFGEMFTAG